MKGAGGDEGYFVKFLLSVNPGVQQLLFIGTNSNFDLLKLYYHGTL